MNANVLIAAITNTDSCLLIASCHLYAVYQKSDQDVSKAVQWEKLLISNKDKRLQPSLDLKLMIRDGISPQFRSRVWKALVGL